MTKLTQRQQEVLDLAAKADGGMIDAASVPAAVTKSLIQRGFMLSTPRSDGGSRLLLTAAGGALSGCRRSTQARFPRRARSAS